MKSLLTAVLLVCGAATGVLSEDCIEYRDYLHRTGIIATQTFPHGIASTTEYSFIAVGDQGLKIFEVADPSEPRLVGTLATDGTCRAIAVDGSLAYLADDGLTTVDIHDPTTPRIINHRYIHGAAFDVEVWGSYVLLGNHDGLYVFDVAEPRNPEQVGFFDTIGHVRDVVAVGTRAYLAGVDLQVLDLSDPTEPHHITTIATSGLTHGVLVIGEYAYVADEDAGLLVVDVAVPSNAAIIGNLESPYDSGARAIALGRSSPTPLVYVGQRNVGMLVVDISVPTDPRVIKTVAATGIQAIDTAGSRVDAATDPRGLQIFDASGPINPQPIATLATPGFARRVAAAGSHVYVADGLGSLQVVDVANAAEPQLIGYLPYTEPIRTVAIAGSHAYLGTQTRLLVVDVVDPGNPVLLGSTSVPWSEGIAIADSHAYIANFGLTVVDIADPTNPVVVFSEYIDGWNDARDVTVAGAYAYLAGHETGLRIIDISDPRQPLVCGFWPFVDSAFDCRVRVVNSHAFYATESLHVLDVSDPTNPHYATSWGVPGLTSGVALAGDHAYLPVDRLRGLQVLDITDPASLEPLGGAYAGLPTLDTAVTANVVVVAHGHGGLTFWPRQCAGITSVEQDPDARANPRSPRRLASLTVSPNPFNPQTEITFMIDHPDYVSVDIVDPAGRHVTSLTASSFPLGRHSLTWDGRDQRGRAVSSGTYFVRFESESYVATRKAMLVR